MVPYFCTVIVHIAAEQSPNDQRQFRLFGPVGLINMKDLVEELLGELTEW